MCVRLIVLLNIIYMKRWIWTFIATAYIQYSRRMHSNRTIDRKPLDLCSLPIFDSNYLNFFFFAHFKMLWNEPSTFNVNSNLSSIGNINNFDKTHMLVWVRALFVGWRKIAPYMHYWLCKRKPLRVDDKSFIVIYDDYGFVRRKLWMSVNRVCFCACVKYENRSRM